MSEVTTSQAQSALMLLSSIMNSLENGQSFRIYPSDAKWIEVILELMPPMPLQDER